MSAPAISIEHFSNLKDLRVERNKKHELIDVSAEPGRLRAGPGTVPQRGAFQ